MVFFLWSAPQILNFKLIKIWYAEARQTMHCQLTKDLKKYFLMFFNFFALILHLDHNIWTIGYFKLNLYVLNVISSFLLWILGLDWTRFTQVGDTFLQHLQIYKLRTSQLQVLFFAKLCVKYFAVHVCAFAYTYVLTFFDVKDTDFWASCWWEQRPPKT